MSVWIFVCQTHMKSFLSVMKSSADDMELKHWFTVMKKRAPNLKTINTQMLINVQLSPQI